MQLSDSAIETISCCVQHISLFSFKISNNLTCKWCPDRRAPCLFVANTSILYYLIVKMKNETAWSGVYDFVYSNALLQLWIRFPRSDFE